MIVDLALAPLAVLAFLGTAVGSIALLVSIVITRFTGKKQLSLSLLKILAGGLGLYFVVMLGCSAFSKDYYLGRGAEKHFCEIDCHLAYSVTKVEAVATTPAEFSSKLAGGVGDLYVVTLRTRFDEKTIGPNRGNGPLSPNPREFYVRDKAGKQYSPALFIAGTPLEQPLRPGESYETRILLRVPPDAKDPQLFLGVFPWPNAFLIGHEDSPLHGKAYFDLKG